METCISMIYSSIIYITNNYYVSGNSPDPGKCGYSLLLLTTAMGLALSLILIPLVLVRKRDLSAYSKVITKLTLFIELIILIKELVSLLS